MEEYRLTPQRLGVVGVNNRKSKDVVNTVNEEYYAISQGRMPRPKKLNSHGHLQNVSYPRRVSRESDGDLAITFSSP